MTRKRISLAIAMLMITLCAVRAQDNIDSLRRANKDIKIPAKLLLGFWNSVDSLHSRIEFVDNTYEIIIEPKWHINNYSFRKENDSVFVSGSALNWPPFYCILNLLDPNNLEIKFYQYYYDKTFDVRYTRDK